MRDCECHQQPLPFRLSRRERLWNWLLGRPVEGWAVEAGRFANERDFWRRQWMALVEQLKNEVEQSQRRLEELRAERAELLKGGEQ